jgi:hypothetical protein
MQKKLQEYWDYSCEYGLVAFPELQKSNTVKENIWFIKDRLLDSW